MPSTEEMRAALRRTLEERGFDTDAAQVKAGRTHFVTDDDGNVVDVAVTIASPISEGTDPIARAADLIQGAGDDEENDGKKPGNKFDRIRAEMKAKNEAEEQRQNRFRDLADRQATR